MLPVKLFAEYKEQMSLFKAEHESAVNNFLTLWQRHREELLEEEKQRLGDTFDPGDYPTRDQMERKFGFYSAYMPFPSHANDPLSSAVADGVAELQEQLEIQHSEALKASNQALLGRVFQAVQHMADKLEEYTPAEQGTRAKGIFRDSLIDNVRELARIVPEMDLGGSELLADIIDDINGKLVKYDAEDLREDDNARAIVAKSAKAIAEKVNGYLM